MTDALDRLQDLHDRLMPNPACGFLRISIDQARAQQDPLFREAATLAALAVAKAITESLP